MSVASEREQGEPPGGEGRDGELRFQLRLYVAGQSRRSIAAIQNLQRICEQYLAERHEVEVIDLLENPERARCDDIFVLPTLVRRRPRPPRKIIGDLSNVDRVLARLNVRSPS